MRMHKYVLHTVLYILFYLYSTCCVQVSLCIRPRDGCKSASVIPRITTVLIKDENRSLKVFFHSKMPPYSPYSQCLYAQ
ncbi:uncharacterized protein YALI1_A01854g [Yarrowia lipolytica]|uniref:Secreted protein n=1 Tax=Yarrowia lipolytica TaxID=4952 RepID=A0A1D8N3D6_YARLL|nr:hypothetical protein YALI1_A01854g [Yarrowia lipolytica]